MSSFPLRCLQWLIPFSISFSSLQAQASRFPELPISHPKLMRARKVFEQLLATHGHGLSRLSKPHLVIKRRGYSYRRRIAWTDPSRDAVIIDEELYDLLRDTKEIALEDGLAFVMGHELAHIALHSGWSNDFAIGLKRDSASIEREADTVGAFLAYVAGFDTLVVGPKVVDAIYSSYDLEATLPGYPSQKERRDLAAKAIQPAQTAAAQYTAGLLLAVTKHHDVASLLLEDLVQKFPSFLLLDAAAVTSMLHATSVGPQELLLPIGFEPPRGIGSAAYPKSFATEAKRSALLKRAELLLGKADRLIPQHPTITTHRICLSLLRSETDKARRELQSARHRLGSADLASISGWLHHMEGHPEAAKTSFEAASQLGDWSAKHNLAYLKLGTNQKRRRSSSRPWQKDGLKTQIPRNLELSRHRIQSTELAWSNHHSLPSAIQITAKGKRLIFRASHFGDRPERTHLGLSREDSLGLLNRLYGEPTSGIRVGNGTFLRYGSEDLGIIFFIANNKVKGWWTYRS